jgi:AraC-like DNA-binding protein
MIAPTASAPLAPMSRHLALATHDLDTARRHLGGVFVDHALFFEGRARTLDCRHHYSALDSISFNSLSYGGDITVQAPPLTDFYLLQFTLSGACEIETALGTRAIGAGSLMAINPSLGYRKRWSAECAQLILRLDRRAIERRIASDLGIDCRRPPAFAFEPMEMRGALPLVRFVDSMCRDLDEAGPGLAHGFVRTHAESTLLALVLSSLEHNYSAAYRGEDGISGPAPACVRRAEDYARAHAGAPIGVDDMALAAGVSARTLHRAFRTFRDTTPLAFVKTLRLDQTRQELARAAQDGRSVADVAMACGLTHLGKFARDYRARFGESPSETRRRGHLS